MCLYWASELNSFSEHFTLISSLCKHFCLQRPLWTLSELRRNGKRLGRKSLTPWELLNQARDRNSTHLTPSRSVLSLLRKQVLHKNILSDNSLVLSTFLFWIGRKILLLFNFLQVGFSTNINNISPSKKYSKPNSKETKHTPTTTKPKCHFKCLPLLANHSRTHP